MCSGPWARFLQLYVDFFATPDIDDPLVPEIAQKYLEDYDGYVKNLKLYTQRYTTADRPADEQLCFSEKERLDRKSAALAESALSIMALSKISDYSSNSTRTIADTSSRVSSKSDQGSSPNPKTNPWIVYITGPPPPPKRSLFGATKNQQFEDLDLAGFLDIIRNQIRARNPLVDAVLTWISNSHLWRKLCSSSHRRMSVTT